MYAAACALTVVLSAVPTAAAPVLSIDPSNTTANIGDVVSLDVVIDDVTDLAAFQFGLTFNPDVLSAIGTTNGPFLTKNGDSDFFLPGHVDPLLGTITLIANLLLAAPAGVSGSGVLFSVAFEVVKGGSSVVLPFFDPDPVVADGLFDSNFLPIEVGVTAGTVRVVPEPATLLSLGVGLIATLAVRRRWSRR